MMTAVARAPSRVLTVSLLARQHSVSRVLRLVPGIVTVVPRLHLCVRTFGERRTRVLDKVATLLCSRVAGHGRWDKDGSRVGQQSRPDELRKLVSCTVRRE